MTAEPTNLAGALASELVRVSAKRERCAEMLRRGDMPALSLMPGIGLMKAALDAGCAAAGRGDALECLKAHAALKGFSDDD